MTITLLVCSKCGKTIEMSGPGSPPGWLVHQRKDALQGHLIIRCPDHVTGHALKQAGLPQDVERWRSRQ